MVAIEFGRDIGTKVRVLGCGIDGVVEGLWIGKTGKKETNVRYYDRSGRACNVWCAEDELADAVG